MPKRVKPKSSPDNRVPLDETVVDSLPYGLVVVQADHTISSFNATARRFLPQLGDVALCHEALSCRVPGGPCEHGCLAARAVARQGALPEIRIDMPPGAGQITAVWVTVAAVGSRPEAVFHLRPGDARDRRRRSDPHWLSGPELRITSFGRTRVDTPEGPLRGEWLQQRPGQLLKYLICERNRVVPADVIAEALWPGTGRQGLGNVRYFMHALREKLEPHRPRGARSSFIVTVQGGYALDRRHVRIDADDFDEAISQGLEAASRSDDDFAVERLKAALALYRGDFLADEPYAEWSLDERDRLHNLAGRALRALTKIAMARRELDAAAEYLEQLAELEPLDGETHRDLLAVWMAQGRRTEAARRYAIYRTRILREFGDEPDFQLADLRPAARSTR
ncbi:MAG TPA: BTAD domain-containing putative transcriptional regulator [Thermoleophilaceae bacterium]|jgi:DNA-binding SARP family transcriptional activator|nr:BTAD domain-containing putative transcriptional regulator [Thermoleophilaceae bacterium]